MTAQGKRASKQVDDRHSDLMQHFRGFLSGPNRCPGCAGRGTTDRGTTCKACLGDGKLTSAVRGSVTTLYGAALRGLTTARR